jgi:hypothetical protein
MNLCTENHDKSNTGNVSGVYEYVWICIYIYINNFYQINVYTESHDDIKTGNVYGVYEYVWICIHMYIMYVYICIY